MALTPEQARQLLQQAGVQNKAAVTPEQARQMLQSAGIQPPKSTMENIGGGIYAGVTGARSGLEELIGGAAKRIAPMIGRDPSQVTQFQPSEAAAGAMAEYPTSAAVGKFGGQALGLIGMGEALPEEALAGGIAKGAQALGMGGKAASMLGRGGAIAGSGAALGPIVDADKPAGEAAAEGALLNLGGAGLLKLLTNAPRQAAQLLKMGGAAPKEGVEKVVQAASDLGVDMPLAEVIKSPGLAKLQKAGLKNIPFSGMAQEYQKLSEGLSGNIQSLLGKLNPENKHSGEAVQDFLSDKYSSLKNTVSDLYGDLKESVSQLAPGNVHDNSSVFSEAQKIKDDFSKKLRRPGGDVKVPKDVKSYVDQISKESINIQDAFADDEIINSHIGDAIAQIRKGGKEAKDAERSLPYWNRLKKQNLADTDKTVERVGSPEISEKWSAAKNFYKENLAPYAEKGSLLKKIISEPNIDKVQNKFLQTSGQQPKSEILNQVADQLPQEVKDTVAHSYLLGPKDGNLIDAISRYEKLQPKQRDALFSEGDKKSLDNLLTIQNHVGKKEFNQMFVPPTGAQVQMTGGALTLPASAAYGMKLGGPVGALLGPAALIGGARGLKSALMSDALKDLYLKASKGAAKPVKKVGPSSRAAIALLGQGGSDSER
jgi:hypothetical protein